MKHQKVSKCYDHDSLQNFISHFMALLTAQIFKNSSIMAESYFIFLKKCPIPNSKAFQYQI